MTPEAQFESIRTSLISQDSEITAGKMMREEAIKFKSKVIAFIYKDEMVFKLGRNYDPEIMGIKDYRHLSPFKNKPPMIDWFIISADYMDKWEALTQEAIARF